MIEENAIKCFETLLYKSMNRYLYKKEFTTKAKLIPIKCYAILLYKSINWYLYKNKFKTKAKWIAIKCCKILLIKSSRESIFV